VRLDGSLTSNFTENGNEESRYFREDVHINFQHRHKARSDTMKSDCTYGGISTPPLYLMGY
jgi:hypothetical protein